MFEITFKDSKTVKGIFEAISAIIEECKIIFDPNGITMNSIDAGRICLVGFNLDKSDFDAYKCEKEYELGLNFDDMVKILRRSSAEDAITLKYDPNKEDSKIKIIMKNALSKKRRQFSLQLINLGEEDLHPEALEEIEYTASALLPIAYLDEAIKDADIFSETVLVSISEENGIVFKAEGSIGESECILEKDDEGIENFNAKEMGQGDFALEYLKNIVKISAIAEKVELSLNPETPLKVKFNIMGSSQFKYFLAPRVEEDEYEEEYNEDF
ncbi:MAG: proliferating cell nuclear antigen (pcna) [Promethearchaeota archaeon]